LTAAGGQKNSGRMPIGPAQRRECNGLRRFPPAKMGTLKKKTDQIQ